MARVDVGTSAGRPIYPIFVVTFLMAVVSVFYANPFFIQSLRYIVFDSYQRISPSRLSAEFPVRIVDIDEASLTRIGQWPWPRSVMATLVDHLGAQGAKAIAVDIMFPEADRTSPEQVLRWQPPERADRLKSLIQDWASNDGLFADAIGKHPVVLAAALTDRGTADKDFPVKAGLVVIGDNPAPFLKSFSTFSGNLTSLTDKASGVGSINWIPDRDQVVRRVPLFLAQGQTLVPSLALETMRVAEDASTYAIKASNASGETAFGRHSGINHVRVGKHVIPTDPDGGIWIKFRRSNPQEFIPAWKVLDDEIDRSEVEGKIVLIGTSAAGLMDLRATPLDAAVPGVEVHQQILEHILSDHFLTRPDYAPPFELIATILAILVLAFVSPRISASAAAVLGVLVISTFFAVAVGAYLKKGLLFDPLYPSLCIFLFEVASAFYLYRRTEIQRAEVRRAFGQYVSPDVVEQLIAHPERLALGGEVRELTLMFCDVRNFTRISEGMTAVELTNFINGLLTPLTDIIIQHRGTIDKYMGDAIMAFWNAPLDDPIHARHAYTAAVDMARKMIDLNADWQKQAAASGRTFPSVRIGIGINTGDCCVGNLGSLKRFDYSAIGDNVNVTSRLEGLTKFYGLQVIFGEETVRQLPGFSFLEVDLVRVKGRASPSRIFTPLAIFSELAGKEARLQAAQEKLLANYRQGRWSEALVALEECRACGVKSLQDLYALYERRITECSKNPPADWDGIYSAEEK